MEILVTGLKQCENLEYINISHNDNYLNHPWQPCTHDGIANKCTKLREVTIACANIGYAGLYWLSSSLSQSKYLKNANLEYSRMKDYGAEEIFTSIYRMGRLQLFFTELNLAGNKIDFEGARALSSCLQYWPNLQSLDVSGGVCYDDLSPVYNIGRDGVMLLTKELHHCTQLKYLNIDNNGIGPSLHGESGMDIEDIKVRQHSNCVRVIQNLSRCTKLTELVLQTDTITFDVDLVYNLARCATYKWEHTEKCLIYIMDAVIILPFHSPPPFTFELQFSSDDKESEQKT